MITRRGGLALLMVALLAAATSGARADELETQFLQQSRALLKSRVPGAPGMTLGPDGWILLTAELDYAAAGQFWGEGAAAANPKVRPELADPVPAIIDFARQLDALGIELIFMPVPIREHLYPESVLGAEGTRLKSGLESLPREHTRFLELLEEQEITVIDLLPVFRRHLNDPHAPLYTKNDAHWTGSGVVLAAERVAYRLARKPWYVSTPKRRYTTQWTSHQHRGPLLEKLEKLGLDAAENGPTLATEEHLSPQLVHVRRVRQEGGGPIEMRSPESPVILMGDSNSVWWQHYDASLAHQLAYELGFPVDVLSTVGGGATDTRLNLVRAAKRSPEYLTTKKALIWCFSARSMTETRKGWLKTPIPAPEHAAPASPAAS